MAVGVFVTLGIVVPIAVCLLTISGPDDSPLILLPLATAVYSAGQLAGQVRRSVAAPLRITFWLYVYIFLGMAGMVQVWTGTFPFLPVADGRLDVNTAYIVVFAGLAAFELASHRKGNARGAVAAYLQQSISTNRLSWLSVGGVLSAIIVTVFVGGADQLFEARETLAARIEEGAALSVDSLAVLGTALRVPMSVAFLGWLVLGTRSPILVRHLTPLVVLAPAVLIVNNPVSTPRFTIGTFAIAAILIAFPPTNARRVRAFLIGSVLTVLLVFPAVDVFRHSTSASPLDDFAPRESIEDLATNPDFDSPSEIAGAVGFVEQHGHTLGRQSLGVALFFVPRGLWATKPDATASIVADYLSLPIRNVGMPLWGFLYVEGGLALVVGGFYLYGRLVSNLDCAYASRRSHHTSIARLAIPLLAGYQFFLLRGDPLPTFGYLAPMVACLAILGPWQHLSARGQDSSPRTTSASVA